jgi:hypothetical protein
MQVKVIITLCAVFLGGCLPTDQEQQKPLMQTTTVNVSVKNRQKPIEAVTSSIPLIIAGEGGPAKAMVHLAAVTYQKEHGGVLVDVHNGDEFIWAIRQFIQGHGKISNFVYFGHGNQVGLFVNQEPGINGSLYANDPRLNDGYRAASIYELPATVFASGSLATFYGCNIARYAPKETMASAFANYFHTTVIASTGPTEFSRSKDSVDRYPDSLSLPSNFSGPVYMVPTFPQKGFITVEPSKGGLSGYSDVTENLAAADAIQELSKRGLSLNTSALFEPYKVITYADAEKFCITATQNSSACQTNAEDKSALIRNLDALVLLMNAFHIPVPHTKTPITGYISEAHNRGFLIPDFTHKRWLTRGEIAMLTWNIIKQEHISTVIPSEATVNMTSRSL